jgi:hypothetical protein
MASALVATSEVEKEDDFDQYDGVVFIGTHSRIEEDARSQEPVFFSVPAGVTATTSCSFGCTTTGNLQRAMTAFEKSIKQIPAIQKNKMRQLPVRNIQEALLDTKGIIREVLPDSDDREIPTFTQRLPGSIMISQDVFLPGCDLGVNFGIYLFVPGQNDNKFQNITTDIAECFSGTDYEQFGASDIESVLICLKDVLALRKLKRIYVFINGCRKLKKTTKTSPSEDGSRTPRPGPKSKFRAHPYTKGKTKFGGRRRRSKKQKPRMSKRRKCTKNKK